MKYIKDISLWFALILVNVLIAQDEDLILNPHAEVKPRTWMQDMSGKLDLAEAIEIFKK